MWIVAGILLGLVVLAAAAGTHAGPHAHLVSSITGAVAAIWLVVMAALGYADPLLYVLLAADVTMSGVMGTFAVKALRSPGALGAANEPPASVEGKMGRAVSDLDPEGVVRVGGEEWTALSLNGSVRRGEEVQVINVKGVRLEVWGEKGTGELGPIEQRGEGAIS